MLEHYEYCSLGPQAPSSFCLQRTVGGSSGTVVRDTRGFTGDKYLTESAVDWNEEDSPTVTLHSSRYSIDHAHPEFSVLQKCLSLSSKVGGIKLQHVMCDGCLHSSLHRCNCGMSRSCGQISGHYTTPLCTRQ